MLSNCKCGGILKYYNIGFDDGYQCQTCSYIYERHEVTPAAREHAKQLSEKPIVFFADTPYPRQQTEERRFRIPVTPPILDLHDPTTVEALERRRQQFYNSQLGEPYQCPEGP